MNDLEKIKELLHTQDNRITANPIFVVEKKVRDYGYDTDYADEYTFIADSGDYEAAGDEDEELAKIYQKTGLVPDGWTMVGYRERWEFVTCCFTEQGCKDFLEINGHNVGESRIFVYGAWRNYEWQAVRNALMAGAFVEQQTDV